MSPPAQISGWTLSGSATPPPTSKYSTIHSRDDLFAARLQRSPIQNTTVSRPRTASSPPRRMVREPVTYGAGISDNRFIGMALGSPRDNPLPLLPRELSDTRSHPTASVPSPHLSSPHALAGPKTGEGDIKHKGKWKMFGGLFGKKDIPDQDSPSPSFYTPQHTSSQTHDRDIISSQARMPSLETSRTQIQPRLTSRGKNITRDGTKRNVLSKKQKQEPKPDMKRARTLPVFRGERRGNTFPSADLQLASTTQDPILDKTPMMLRVNIPDVSMERYSVMFSDVLKTAQPSLMMRRQTQLMALNTTDIKEESVLSPQCR